MTRDQVRDLSARFVGAGRSRGFRLRVRARMDRTGETYVVARLQLLLDAETEALTVGGGMGGVFRT